MTHLDDIAEAIVDVATNVMAAGNTRYVEGYANTFVDAALDKAREIALSDGMVEVCALSLHESIMPAARGVYDYEKKEAFKHSVRVVINALFDELMKGE